MPFKQNAARHHRVPKQRYKGTNWPIYEAALKRHGDFTCLFDDAALARWQGTTPGGQPRYSNPAIELVLILRLVFHLFLRQAEAFGRSILRLLGLELAVARPYHPVPARLRLRRLSVSGCRA